MNRRIVTMVAMMGVSGAASGSMLLSLGGCAASDPADVGSGTYDRVKEGHGKVTVGMSKDEVFKHYKGANIVKLSTASIGGESLEEWKVEAARDKSGVHEVFVKFLTFSDGKLVDVNDKREPLSASADK